MTVEIRRHSGSDSVAAVATGTHLAGAPQMLFFNRIGGKIAT
jgi:hypothetical protein